jgi:transposase
MWLGGGNQPDFRTLNQLRGQTMQAVSELVVAAVLEYLVEAGYVRLEHSSVDGTKIEANANKHQVVWAKRTAKNKACLGAKIQGL